MATAPKISVTTGLAIDQFRKVVRLEQNLAKAQAELRYWVAKVPEEDMAEYMRVTTEIQAKAES